MWWFTPGVPFLVIYIVVRSDVVVVGIAYSPPRSRSYSYKYSYDLLWMEEVLLHLVYAIPQ